MAVPTSFPLVRGRAMRVTKLDACGAPDYGEDNLVVSEGFVSVALTAIQNEGEEITVTNANGKTCVRDPGVPEFQGYNVEITFCDVTPCLFSIVTGQPVVLNDATIPEAIGFRMNTNTDLTAAAFALEVWMGVPGVACSGAGVGYGYLLLPFLAGGVVGDFTIENAAVTFTVTGITTRGGNQWGVGENNVVAGVLPTPGTPEKLTNPLDPDDHLVVLYTEIAPPAATAGCVELIDPSPSQPMSSEPAAVVAVSGAPVEGKKAAKATTDA
jgi:hypothetical protein